MGRPLGPEFVDTIPVFVGLITIARLTPLVPLFTQWPLTSVPSDGRQRALYVTFQPPPSHSPGFKALGGRVVWLAPEATSGGGNGEAGRPGGGWGVGGTSRPVFFSCFLLLVARQRYCPRCKSSVVRRVARAAESAVTQSATRSSFSGHDRNCLWKLRLC